MPVINIPIPESGLNIEQLANAVAIIAKELQYLLNGSLDVQNIRASSITADRLKVQQLSAIAADLGHITAGLIEAVNIYGSYIATANGTYPRIEFSSSANLLKALFSATNSISIAPVYGSNPAILFDDGTAQAFLSAISGDMQLTVSTGTLTLQSDDNNVFIFAGSGKKVIFNDWAELKNQTSGHTLQTDLDAKVDKPGTTFTGSFSVITSVDFAGSTTTSKTISVSNGVITSVV